MNKYFGIIGYGIDEEIRPGVHKPRIVERKYYGDVLKNTRRYDGAAKVNDDLAISNSLSIVADPFAYQNFHCIKYATYMGSKWTVKTVETQYPRLILTLGELYNGQTNESETGTP